MENDVFVEGAIDPSDRAVFPRYALTVNRFIMGEIGLFASVRTARLCSQGTRVVEGEID